MAKKNQADNVVSLDLESVTKGGSYVVDPATGAIERVEFMQENKVSVQALVDAKNAATAGATEQE